MIFLSVFGTFAHKVAQTWFVLHETWHTKLFGIYYCVEVVISLNHSHILEITCYVAILRIFIRFWHFCAKKDQTWFFFHETWQTPLFGIFSCVEVVKIVYHSDILEITC